MSTQTEETHPAPSPAPEGAPKYDVLSPAHYADPHPTLHRMRAEDPVYWHPLLNAWLLTRHADIQTIARDPRFSAEQPDRFRTGTPPHVADEVAALERFLSSWMVFIDPPRHTALRSLVAKAFTPAVVDGLRPFVERLVEEILDSVCARGSMDVIADLATPVPAMVIARMLGVQNKDIGPFKQWTNEIIAFAGAGVATEEMALVGYRGMVALEAFFKELIADRRRHPGDDLLSRLIRVEEQGTALNEMELVAMCTLLLVAGHETTTHQIGNSILALLRHPEELERLRADPKLMNGAVEELLRHDSAVKVLARRATEDLELGGQPIRAGQLVFGLIHAGNRDPACFPDPDRLDLTRKDIKSIPFGYGVHYCLGAPLARMELSIVLRQVLARLQGLRLATSTLEWLPNFGFQGLTALPVSFEAQREAPASLSPPSMRDVALPVSQRSVSLIPPSGPLSRPSGRS
jgi:cytochrome P450